MVQYVGRVAGYPGVPLGQSGTLSRPYLGRLAMRRDPCAMQAGAAGDASGRQAHIPVIAVPASGTGAHNCLDPAPTPMNSGPFTRLFAQSFPYGIVNN